MEKKRLSYTIPIPHHVNLSVLTRREWDVLFLLTNNLHNAAIAECLCITTRSVINYRNRIGDKLLLKGHHALADFARNNSENLQQWYQVYRGMSVFSLS